jgi:hypothetical protein
MALKAMGIVDESQQEERENEEAEDEEAGSV